MPTLTENLGLVKHASGYEGWADDMNANLDIVDRATGNIMSMNPVINCDMSQWQRGDSFSVSGVMCTADRWAASYTGCIVSRQSHNGKSILRFGRAEGETTLNCLYVGQIIDTPNAVKFRGKTITLSWRLRKGSTFSADWLNIAIMSSTVVNDTYNGSLDLLSATLVNYATIADNISTDFQTFTVVGTIPEDCNTLSIKIGYKPTGTAGSAEYIEMDWVQINIGDVALPFVPRDEALELMLCQRYFWMPHSKMPSSADLGTTANYFTIMTLGCDYAYIASAHCGGGGGSNQPLTFPVRMRAPPTIKFYGNSNSAYSGTTWFQNCEGTESWIVMTPYIVNDKMAIINGPGMTAGTSAFRLGGVTFDAELY